MAETKQAAALQNPLGRDNILRLLIRFSVPAIISLLVNAVYNIVDQIFIGQDMGFLGIAATNVALPLTTISTAVALLLGVGCAANFNLKLGAGDKETASYIAGNALSLMVIIGVGISVVVLLFISPLLTLFGTTNTVMPLALPYTAIIAPGIPFLIFSTGACNLIRADGSPTYSMGCMLAGALFNIVFDPIFLFVFHMGIEGIALATTLGQVLSSIIALLYLVKRFRSTPLKRQHLRPRARYGKAICALGMASCFNQLAITVVQIVSNNTLRHYGALSAYGSDIPLAAVGAISKLNILYMAFTIGVAQGNQPIVSFNYGARQYQRVKNTLRNALVAVTGFSIIAYAIFQVFAPQLLAIFGENDPLYLDYAVRYMRVFTIFTFINGIQPVTANFFTSIGKAKRGILISLTRQIIFFVPLLLILPLFFALDGVMYAAPISDMAAAATAIILITLEMKNMTALQHQAEPAKTEPA